MKALRKKLKKYYSEKISEYKHDAKKIWCIMKELIGKIKLHLSNLPRRVTVNDVDNSHEFNAFFTNIGSELASKTPNASRTFESYIYKPESVMETKQFWINKLENAFFSLKINKSPGYDISFNVPKKMF